MKATLAAIRPREASSAHGGSDVISRQASPRSTSRRKSQRNAPVAAEPMKKRARLRRQRPMSRKYAQAMAMRGRRKRRFSGRREVAIGLGVYATYLLVRRAVVNEQGRLQAARNAERIVALERRLGLHVEPVLQAGPLPRPPPMAGSH